MNARLRFMVVVAVLAILALPLVMWALASPTPPNCCQYVVDNHSECSIRICAEYEWPEIQDTTGVPYMVAGSKCDTIIGMGRHPVGLDGKGCTVTKLAILDWNDLPHAIPMAPGQCADGIRIGPNCAARICYDVDPATGCPLIRVLPLPGCKCW